MIIEDIPEETEEEYVIVCFSRITTSLNTDSKYVSESSGTMKHITFSLVINHEI